MALRARTTTRDDPPKPLWHFGWAGWTLLVVAIALGVVYFTGYDLRTLLMTIIAERLGIPALFRFTIYGILAHGLAFGTTPPIPVFTVIGAWCVLPGVAVHPRRFGYWRGLCLLLVSVTLPGVWLYLRSVVGAWFVDQPGSPGEPWASACGAFVSMSSVALLGALMVLLLYRARLVALALVLVGLFGAWITIEFDWTFAGGELLLPRTLSWMGFAWIGWAFNPAILAASLYWGIAARRAWKPAWACQSCGYDLRGSGADICPECGTLCAPRRASSASSG